MRTNQLQTPVDHLLDVDALRADLRGGGRICKRWGRNVLNMRGDRGLSQRQLADLAGITRPTLSRIESGDLAAGDAVRFALAYTLGTTVERLFPWPEGDDVAAYLAEAA